MDPEPPIIDPSDSPQVLELKRQLYWAQLKVQHLEELLRLQRIKKYGPASEKLSSAQLELLEEEPGVSNREVQAESEREALPPREKPKPERKHPGRQQLPADLPRKERVIPCPPQECRCKHCGEPTEVIGYEESEQLDVEPAKYFVLVTKREKRGCRSCQQGVTTAAAPVRIIEKSLVSDRVVIDTVVSKYCDHLPLYRQSAILERETGVEISRATLDGWVMRVGELLMPVAGAIGKELLAGGYIQADETPVDVQVHAACWAHARRKFVEAHRVSPEETLAKGIVEVIDELFAIDAEARAGHYDVAARDGLRQERAPALLESIKQKIEAARKQALPSSKLGQACAYTLGLWGKLKCFLEHPELELSNNLAENSMRPVAVGRKNWIHVGSAEAGPRVAAILSTVETCRRLAIPVRKYLAAVLPGLAGVRIQKLAELTPAAWAGSGR